MCTFDTYFFFCTRINTEHFDIKKMEKMFSENTFLLQLMYFCGRRYPVLSKDE